MSVLKSVAGAQQQIKAVCLEPSTARYGNSLELAVPLQLETTTQLLFLTVLTPSLAWAPVWMVHFLFPGNQNRSHHRTNAAPTGAKEESGGQISAGAKSASVNEDKGVHLYYIYYTILYFFFKNIL